MAVFPIKHILLVHQKAVYLQIKKIMPIIINSIIHIITLYELTTMKLNVAGQVSIW